MNRIKKLLLTFSILLPGLCLGAPGEREWRVVIENKYLRSKTIWGTYGQTSLKTSLKKKKSLSVRDNLAANMMLKNGRMILIQPVSLDGITSYRVKDFPYKRKSKKRYQVTLKNGRNKFLEIYKDQLIAVLLKNKIDPDTVDWSTIELDEMSCKSRKRNFNCKIPLLIKAKTNS